MLALDRESTLERAAEAPIEREADAVHWGRKLHASQAFLDRTGQLAGVGGWQVELGWNEVQWSAETCRIHDPAPGYRPAQQEALAFYPPETRETMLTAMSRSMSDGTGWDLELPLVTASPSTWITSRRSAIPMAISAATRCWWPWHFSCRATCVPETR